MDSTSTLAVGFERQLTDLRDSVEIQYLDQDGIFQRWNGYVGDPGLSIHLVGLLSPQISIVEERMGEEDWERTWTLIPLAKVITVVVCEFDRNAGSDEEPYRPVSCWVQYGGELRRFG